MGRPRGSSTEAAKLRKALKRVEKRRGIDFYERFAEMALDNPMVMVAIMKKLVPDLRQVEQVLDAPKEQGMSGVIVVLPDNGRGDLFTGMSGEQGN